MLTSNRSDFRPYTRSVSATNSNRRVRTRTHGGVAGVGGQPPPLCRSSRVVEHRKALVDAFLGVKDKLCSDVVWHRVGVVRRPSWVSDLQLALQLVQVDEKR